jgi:hypothetical protein
MCYAAWLGAQQHEAIKEIASRESPGLASGRADLDIVDENGMSVLMLAAKVVSVSTCLFVLCLFAFCPQHIFPYGLIGWVLRLCKNADTLRSKPTDGEHPQQKSH